MASDPKFVESVMGQLKSLENITPKKMFGEYAIYASDKIVALISDNQLFVKPTPGGRALIQDPVEASPYPGAKSCFLIQANIQDADWLCQLIQTTAAELPSPAKKKRKP
jgi:TfoX/Sxy family transcriptional regulator of competence genes